MKEIKRTPLVMLPNGSFVRGQSYVSEGIVVKEPPLYEKPPAVIDQTKAARGEHE
mgnify:FL=1